MKPVSTSSVKLLDCSLRDGSHVNKGFFGERTISNVIAGLTQAHIEVIEVGFLMDGSFDRDQSYFDSIEEAQRYIPGEIGALASCPSYAVMARVGSFSFSGLKARSGPINTVRIAFRPQDTKDALRSAQVAHGLGYSVHLNPVHTPGYRLDEISALVESFNLLSLDAFSVVDTYGVLNPESLATLICHVDSHLDPRSAIGVHLHENLGLSLAMATKAVSLSQDLNRSTSIDASLSGIGRIPGNLPLELIAQHLNLALEMRYDLPLILRLISTEIEIFSRSAPWGYSPPYGVSASFGLDRSFPEFFLEQGLDNLGDIFLACEWIANRERTSEFSEATALAAIAYAKLEGC